MTRFDSVTHVVIREPSLADIQQAQSATSKNDLFIQLPRFQRGIVWSENQRKSLVDSIFKGFPIGSFLAFDTGTFHTVDNKQRAKVELVDGLQRATTIIAFLNEPLKYAPADQLFEDEDICELTELATGELSEDSKQEILSAISEWAEETKTARIPAGFNAPAVITKIQHVASVHEVEWDDVKNGRAVEIINDALQEIQDGINKVQNIKVPIVTYTGSSSNVPTIFERINSQGIKLSKYEQYAASWINAQTHIENPKIRDFVQAKYDELISQGYEVDLGQNGVIPKDEFNLFEYLFGLGKLLSEKFDFLFPESDKPDDSPSVAFVVTTIANKLRINQMDGLAEKLQKSAGAHPIRLDDFEAALLDACSIVQDAIRPHMSLKLNAQGAQKRFLPHSQNQVISYVVRVLIEKYDSKTWKPKPSNNLDQLKKNIPLFYLFDIVHGRWSGSGDSRLSEMVWDTQASGIQNPSTFYMAQPSRTDFESALNTWHEEQLKKKQRERASVTADAKMLLRFLYSDIITVRQDQGVVFDLEHLFPVAVLTEAITNSTTEEGWPISALGNLSLLPSDVNRIKQKNMLGEYLASSAGASTTQAEKDTLQNYVISPEIESLVNQPPVTKDSYEQFCRDRFNVIREKLLTSLGF